jgi:5'-deoxynucleotidase YfbR-like HD superfamily hydrolase
MGMLYLPDEYPEQMYNKQTVLDMILIHDMAEAVIGDCCGELSEPTKELKAQNNYLRKSFLKGTYPEVANMTRYYDIWDDYYRGQSINARVARDLNLLQTVNTFFSYFSEKPDDFSYETVKEWLNKGDKLSTNIGYDLFERIIVKNPIYRKATDYIVTKQ